MNIKRAGILLGAAILISAPLAYSPQAEARGGQGSHKGDQGQQTNRGHRGRGGQHSNRGHGEHGGQHSNRGHGGRGDYYRGERPDYYGHRHGRYRCDSYRCGGYGYHYAPYDYYYDSRLVLGLPWPYGITFIYQD